MALAGGFTWSDGAGGTLREREGREVVLCSASGMSLCLRFIQLFREVCQGTRKPVAAAQDLLSSTLTKKMVGQLMASAAEELPKPPPVEVPDSTRHVQPVEVTLQSPLMALRRAQLEIHAAGGKVLGDALGRTRLAKDLGTVEEEEFTLELLAWLSRFAEELVVDACEPEFQESSSAAQCVEWLLSQRALDPKFSLVLGGNPRAPKKVLAAAKRDAATLELERLQQSGQRFLPNPAKIKGFVKRGENEAKRGEATWVPERLRFLIGEASLLREPSPPNSWQGDEYEPCEAEETGERFLQDPKYLRKATVRIDEILSFEYLQHVGQTMRNCLRVERRGGMSLMKYLSRGLLGPWKEVAPVQHLLLMEVYNGLNVIHQAEALLAICIVLVWQRGLLPLLQVPSVVLQRPLFEVLRDGVEAAKQRLLSGAVADGGQPRVAEEDQDALRQGLSPDLQQKLFREPVGDLLPTQVRRLLVGPGDENHSGRDRAKEEPEQPELKSQEMKTKDINDDAEEVETLLASWTLGVYADLLKLACRGAARKVKIFWASHGAKMKHLFGANSLMTTTAVSIGCGSVGCVAGGCVGGLCGVPCALFTFGLSIPFGAFLGSDLAGLGSGLRARFLAFRSPFSDS
eukprot:g1841.t1